MRRSYNKRSLLSLIILTILLAVVIPATALGQGRGRGNGRGGIFGNPNNKCGKFVNCHDARDGRWDGRGPRGDRIGNRLRFRRNRDIDTDRFVLRNRRVSRYRTNFWRNRGRRIQRRVRNDQ